MEFKNIYGFNKRELLRNIAFKMNGAEVSFYPRGHFGEDTGLVIRGEFCVNYPSVDDALLSFYVVIHQVHREKEFEEELKKLSALRAFYKVNAAIDAVEDSIQYNTDDEYFNFLSERMSMGVKIDTYWDELQEQGE